MQVKRRGSASTFQHWEGKALATVHEFKDSAADSEAGRERFSGLSRLQLRGHAAVEKILHGVQRHGAANTFYDLTLRAMNRAVFLKIYRGISVQRPDPEFLSCPAKYIPMFLSEGMIRAMARNPENDLSARFVEAALARGDECYGIFHGDALAAYGWYSHQPTPLEVDLVVHFSPAYVYMYKGFTHQRYRGERLHAIGMSLALQSYLSQGFRGLVSIVESNNFSSLKSVIRMGYAPVGSIYAMKILGRYLTYGTKGCDGFGLCVEQTTVEPPSE